MISVPQRAGNVIGVPGQNAQQQAQLASALPTVMNLLTTQIAAAVTQAAMADGKLADAMTRGLTLAEQNDLLKTVLGRLTQTDAKPRGDERRASKRRPVKLTGLLIKQNETLGCDLRDLSAGGARVLLDVTLKTGDGVRLEIPRENIVTQAVVVAADHGVAHLRFLDVTLDESQVDRIAKKA